MKTFVVLGMHRSGTSLLAKALHTFSNDPPVSMGEIMLEDTILPEDRTAVKESNPQGHFEDDEFMQLNERILRAAGGSWFAPPPLKRILALTNKHNPINFTSEIKELVGKHKDPIWGWKDPRTCLTIDLFHPHLENPHYICMFRAVDDVADSLVRRDAETIGMTKEYAADLAREYNRRIYQFINKTGVMGDIS